MADSTEPLPRPSGLRQFQTFGDAGPAYEVLSVDESRGIARIYVFESDEEVDYRLSDALSDPPA